MKCQDVLDLIPAYADGELDLLSNLKVEQHLQDCMECTRTLENLTKMKNAMQDNALRYKAPAQLRYKIEASLNDAAPYVSQTAPGMIRSRQPWLRVGALAALVLIGVMLLARPQLNPVAHDSIGTQAVSDHIRSRLLDDAHLLDVVTSDRHTVKPWLSARLNFSPPVPDLSAQGFTLVGGRLDVLDQKTVAALVYRTGKHTINVFVWPSEPSSEPHSKHSENIEGYSVETWWDSGMNFCAVSDASPQAIDALTNLMSQSTPPPSPTTLP